MKKTLFYLLMGPAYIAFALLMLFFYIFGEVVELIGKTIEKIIIKIENLYREYFT